MKKSKGFTLVELLVSIVLISTVFIFIMNLFVRVRSFYNDELDKLKYEMNSSIISDYVMGDMKELRLNGVSINGDNVVINFDGVTRYLKVKKVDDKYYIEYANTLDSSDVIVVREIPENAYISSPHITLNDLSVDSHQLYEIKIPMQNSTGVDYTIDLFLTNYV